MKLKLFFITLFISSINFAQIYVNKSANGTNDGTSWANAFTNLQPALDSAIAGNEVWVASGTYYPTESPDDVNNILRNRAFHFNVDLKLYGGFVGTETLVSQRNSGNTTILNGNIGNSGRNTDNCYHILITKSLTNSSIIDSFTITNGNANGTTFLSGTYTPFQSTGAGMHNFSSSPTISNVVFTNNNSTKNGAGMHNYNSSPVIKNTIFNNNTSSDGFGGALENDQRSNAKIINTLFTNNTAKDGGGAVFNYNFSNVIFRNTTFANNNSTTANGTITGGGAMFNFYFSTPTIYNSAFWNNKARGVINAEHTGSNPNATITAANNASDDRNAPGWTQNIFRDPFLDSTDADGADDIYGTSDDGFFPKTTASNSALVPFKDRGNNAYNSESIDITGSNRIFNTRIDIGAYEYVAVDRTLTLIATNGTIATNPISANDVYSDGSVVTLTATPNAGFEFESWSGNSDINVTGTPNIIWTVMDADKSITANFKPIQRTLTLNAVNGNITQDIAPINGTFADGTVITFTAKPNTGFQFDRWSGDTTGSTNPISVTMDADKSVTAIFTPIQRTLTLNNTNGVINTNINPINGTYNTNSTVILTAIPDAGYQFDSWSGDVNVFGAPNPISITLDTDKSVTAIFIPIPERTLTLVVANAAINAVPLPINGTYEDGTMVTLTVVPDNGYQFDYWGGAAGGTSNTVTVVMDRNKTVGANTSPILRTLQLSAIDGTISATPSSNNNLYNDGTQLTLTAVPNAGYVFVNWSEDASGTTNPITITLDSNKNITANFSTTASIKDINSFYFEVYPNPSKNQIILTIDSEIKKGEIYNLLGKKVLNFNQKKINIESLSKGIYLIKIENKSGEIGIKKIIKK